MTTAGASPNRSTSKDANPQPAGDVTGRAAQAARQAEPTRHTPAVCATQRPRRATLTEQSQQTPAPGQAPPPGQPPSTQTQQQPPTPPAPPAPPAGGDPWTDPAAAKAEIEKLRKESASYRTQVRELQPMADKFREAEAANQTELEKATNRANELEASKTAAEQQAARYEVAMAKGLTLDQAKRLVGNTKEELEADADQLRKDLGLGDPGQPNGTTQRPTEVPLTKVPVPNAGPAQMTDMNEWMRQKKG